MFTETRLRKAQDEMTENKGNGAGDMRRIFGYSLDRIRNAGEVLACRMLEQKLEGCPEINRTQDVIEDIYCLALNRVPSLYYHSHSSFGQRVEDQGPPTDIFEALDKALDYAILQVMEKPRRD